jgi:hypothetical protein
MARSTTAAAGLVGVALVAVLALAGCVPWAPTPVPTETAAVPSSGPTSTAPAVPVLVEGGTAKENQPYFDKVNLEYFTANGTGSSKGIVDSLVTAGFRKQDIEVTPDRTSIDLQADSIVVSVRLKGECLIGDFQASGLKSIVAPLLGTGGCLIGKTLTIDW